MTAMVIVGAQWGDEGKGKVVDRYAQRADVVVRYAGGPNAGHTLVVGERKVVVRLLPSGVLSSRTRCILGQGMVIDPLVLVDEIASLEDPGLTARLSVSQRAHMILPYHLEIDARRELAAGEQRALGTTKKGIGPAYEDKARRTGIPLGLLKHPERLREAVAVALSHWLPVLDALGGKAFNGETIVNELLASASSLVPLLADTSALVSSALGRRQKIIFEGAQGTLLDLDHGTYPYVTSSSAIAAGALVGAGVGPRSIDKVVGITKAYVTRVGAGPFPTELFDDQGKRLQEQGGEFGSVTGRPRRTGWLDLPALRYACRINGIEGLALTKLDVLRGLSKLRICIAYETSDGKTRDFPVDALSEEGIRPVYEELPGFDEDITSIRSLDELPKAAKDYLETIEHALGVPLILVSLGPDRDATIELEEAFG